MSYPRNASEYSGLPPKSPRPRNWMKRIVVALAVTGVLGTVLVVTLVVMAARFVGDAVDYLQSMDMTTMETRMAEAALNLDQRQREIIAPLFDKLKNNELTLPQREEIEQSIMEALGPEQRKQIETWKSIGIPGGQGLNGLMASAILWLEEHGVPVGLLMGAHEYSPQPR